MRRRALGRLLSRFAAMLAVTALAVSEAPAHAQSRSTDPSRIEVAMSPGGVIVFPEEQLEPGFANYRLGGALTVNLSRFIAFEAEAGAAFGISRSLDFGIEADPARAAPDSQDRHPTTLDYHANLVFNLRTDSRVIPYLTGGAGAITLFSRDALGLDDNENYFTGNAGGGLKWLLRNSRWGLRADYRFLAVRSKGDAPAFFGRTNRYGHRLYGALIVILDEAE